MMTAPVKPHIYKMLRRDYQYEGVLEFNKRLHLFIHTNTKAIKQYFLISPEDTKMKTITVLMRYINEKKLYAIIRGLEREFRDKMHVYMQAQVEAGKPAFEAMKAFLDLYDISDEELKYSSCYKSWQRYKEEESKKENIRLWV